MDRDKRLELQAILEGLIGSKNVYFQPPESIKMRYPAIVYAISGVPNVLANDAVYLPRRRYSVTVIDADPDSEIVSRFELMREFGFDRRYTKDQLNHTVFTIQY